MNERRSERRSVADANASQTRPDQTRVVVTAVRGSSVADQSQSVKAVEARGSRRLGLVIER